MHSTVRRLLALALMLTLSPAAPPRAADARTMRPNAADPSCFSSFSSCVLSPGQSISTQFTASGACSMHTVGPLSTVVRVTFNPIVLSAGQTSTVTFTAANAHVVSGGGAVANASYSCGTAPAQPTSIVINGMIERPCPPGPAYPANPCHKVGQPVDVTTGEELYDQTDLAFEGPFGIAFKRHYGTLSIGVEQINGATVGPTDLGAANWQSNYDAYLYFDSSANRYAFHDDAGQVHFLAPPAAGASTYASLSAMTLAASGDNLTHTVTAWDGHQWTFDSAGELTSLADRYGNVQSVARDAASGHNNRIASVADPLGRKLCFFYDGSNRITSLSWQPAGTCPASAPTSGGTRVTFTYDSGTTCTTGQLCAVTEPDGHKWSYQYASGDPSLPNGLTAVLTPNGTAERTTYLGGQVVQQASGTCTTFPCSDTGNSLKFAYPVNGANVTLVTDGENRQTAFTYDINSYLVQQIAGPLCACGGDQIRTYAFDGDQRVVSVTDDAVDGSTKHTVSYAYGRDANGLSFPGPTAVTENLDTTGTTRTTTYAYYPVGDPRQDLVQTTTAPSVDVPGGTTTTMDAYATNGTLVQRQKTGYVNGVSTTYAWAWAYDARGRQTSMTGPRTDVTQLTTYAYFSDGDGDRNRAGQLQSVTDALHHVTSFAGQAGFTSYDPFGHPQSKIDSNGVVTEYTYDPRGRLKTATLLGVAADTQNLVSTWTYDGTGRLTGAKRPAGNAVQYAYDTSDRLRTQTRIDASNLQHERLVLSYNANDQVTKRQAQLCATPSTACSSWKTTWSRAYAFSPATGSLVSIVNADNTVRRYGYTAAGAVAAIGDERHANGLDFAYGYDVGGRRIAETRVLGTGSVTTRYARDLHDNVAAFTDRNGNVTTKHFDDFDRPVSVTSPVSGTSTFTYDAASNRSASADANGVTTTYAYDALDRPISAKSVQGSAASTTTWTYDDATAGHFGIGRLAQMNDPSGSTAYTYDRRGLIAILNRAIAAQPFTQSYTYDPNGNRKTITYPDGYIVGTSFDFADRPAATQHQLTLSHAALLQLRANGAAADTRVRPPESRISARVRHRAATANATAALMTRAPHGATTTAIAQAGAPPRSGTAISRIGRLARLNVSPPAPVAQPRTTAVTPNAASADTFVSAATYEPFGPLASIVFGNGTQESFTYNARYFPVDHKLLSPSNTILADYGYAEDAVGNITSLSDNVDATYDRTFAYDDLNRITTANAGASLWGTGTGNGYSYDPLGDLKTLQLGSARNDTFSYAAGASGSAGLPELSTVVESGTARPVTYDAVGNETGDGIAAFSYSPRELLASDSRTIAAYAYDGFRKRVATTLATGLTRASLLDTGGLLLAESAQFSTATPAIAYKYVWLGNRPVAQVDGNGTHWTFADHLGTPLLQTDLSAIPSWRAEYEPFGSVYALRGADVHQPLRLPGQVSEQFETGGNGATERSYNNARWYRPNWGRYTQPDPIGLRGGQNLYEYASDDPALLIDPTGLSPDADGPQLPGNAQLGWYESPTYGNYCGQYRTNGQSTANGQNGYLPFSIGGPDNPPPTDGTDACCLAHDQKTAYCNIFVACTTANQETCRCGVDRDLTSCLGGSAAASASFSETLYNGMASALFTVKTKFCK